MRKGLATRRISLRVQAYLPSLTHNMHDRRGGIIYSKVMRRFKLYAFHIAEFSTYFILLYQSTPFVTLDYLASL